MNLNAVANGLTQTVNPNTVLEVRVSTGSATNADGVQVPSYATPGTYTGSIDGDELNIATVGSGVIQVGQLVAGADVLPGTRVVALRTGTGGTGTYQVTNDQVVDEEDLVTSRPCPGNVQPIAWKDLQQLDGLNLQGTRYSIYLYGRVEGIVRPDVKGGDLLVDPLGRVYLVAQVLAQWGERTWCNVAATLQNGN